MSVVTLYTKLMTNVSLYFHPCALKLSAAIKTCNDKEILITASTDDIILNTSMFPDQSSLSIAVVVQSISGVCYSIIPNMKCF